MDSFLKSFIMDETFPCIMAKSVLRTGQLKHLKVENLNTKITQEKILHEMYRFIDLYRQNPKKLSSFIISIKDQSSLDFSHFQLEFWNFLKALKSKDQKLFMHDPRVGSDPNSEDFSYSLKEEAFFILALHPDSPRLARKFKYPTIVFNPHQQFEALRLKGIFKKVRDTIRNRDLKLQGSINPMLTDFGERSEVFQYLGIKYPLNSHSPL